MCVYIACRGTGRAQIDRLQLKGRNATQVNYIFLKINSYSMGT